MSENARGLILQLLNRNPAKRLGAGPRDSEDIKSHIFFKDVDWKMVIEKKLPVPKPRIRKIEPNPAISIQSFILEEEKTGLPSPASPKGNLSPRGDNLSPRAGSKQGAGSTQSAVKDENNIAGWSYIKKPSTHF